MKRFAWSWPEFAVSNKKLHNFGSARHNWRSSPGWADEGVRPYAIGRWFMMSLFLNTPALRLHHERSRDPRRENSPDSRRN